jgi:hypothetical protein
MEDNLTELKTNQNQELVKPFKNELETGNLNLEEP